MPIPSLSLVLRTETFLDQLLDELFGGILAKGWVWDWLFTPNPRHDLDILTNPLQLLYAVAAKLRISNSDPFDGEDTAFLGSYGKDKIQISAFHRDGCTAGLVIEERANIRGAEQTEQQSQWVRFIRFVGANVNLLQVSKNPSQDTITLKHCKVLSSLNSTSSTICFHLPAFEGTMRNIPHGQRARRAKAIIKDFKHVDLRRYYCPRCKSSPSARCGCTLEYEHPQHRQDFSHEHTNYSLFAGKFYGSAYCDTYVSGVKADRSAHVMSKVRVFGMGDADVARRLLRWGTENRSSTLPIHITNLTMPRSWDQAQSSTLAASLALPSSSIVPTGSILPTTNIMPITSSMPSSSGTSQAAASATHGSTADEDERQAKRARRIERNRASAKKSNRQRQAHVNAVRRDLALEQQRVEELLAQERVQREENRRLRIANEDRERRARQQRRDLE